MKKIFYFFALTSLFASAALINSYATDKNQKRESIVVVKVFDGDTIQATRGKEVVTIRLADVDCAESTKKSRRLPKQIEEWGVSEEEIKKQGKKSKAKLDALLKLYAEDITFVETPEKVCKTGNGDRLVGILYAKDINVNDFMLKEGKCKSFTCADK